MTEYADWRRKYPDAAADLERVIGAPHWTAAVAADAGSEAAAQQQIRFKFAHRGGMLWRNNVGACIDERGNRIRYGLANESKQMNSKIKSADLIGITPVTITPPMVGAVLGVFTSIECKRPGWQYKANTREQAQLAWAELILSMGGFAQFATDPRDIWLTPSSSNA